MSTLGDRGFIQVPSNGEPLTDAVHVADQVVDGHLLLSAFGGRSLSLSQIQGLSPVALAYLGDAVYELYTRRWFLLPPQRIQAYHQQVVAHVRAEAQARHLQTLLPHLTAIEIEWVKRGRNAATHRSRRVEADIYQQATSFETLIGYLYLANPERLIHLLDLLDFTPTNQIKG